MGCGSVVAVGSRSSGRALLPPGHAPPPALACPRVSAALGAASAVVAPRPPHPAAVPRGQARPVGGVPTASVGPGNVLPLARISMPPNAQALTQNSKAHPVRTDKYGSQCSNGYQFARRCFALWQVALPRLAAPRSTTTKHEPAKSRELRSPALLPPAAWRGEPTRQLTALGGKMDARLVSYHFAPLALFPSHQAHALPHRAAKQKRGTAPKARCLLTLFTPLRYAS